MTHDLPDTVISMRTFVPAKDFGASQDFYRELGFEIRSIAENLADVGFGNVSFILQDFYVEEWAANFMMYLLVRDIDGWWSRIESANLVGRYGVRPPRPPQVEPWGAKVAHVFDPSGVLWHIAEHTRSEGGHA